MMETARHLGDDALQQQCRDALTAFPVRRMAGMVDVNQLDVENDPYGKWMARAVEGLKVGPV